MLNDKSIRALYSKPEFKQKVELKKTKPKKTTPVKESNLKLVIDQIKRNKGITRQRLFDRTGLSFSCLNRCFKHLLANKTITRVAIKNAGAYKVYAYYIKES